MAVYRQPASVFRPEGEYWTVHFAGVTCRLRDAVGLRYVAVLLLRPGERIAAVELAARGSRAVSRAADVIPNGHRTPLEGEVCTANERARIRVTRAIRRAMKRIGEHHPVLGGHLDTTLRTGTFCTYQPDARVPIRWEVSIR